MKILVVSDSFYPNYDGGAGLIAHLQAKGLREAGHEVQAFTANQNQSAFEVDGVHVTSMKVAYPARFRRLVSLYNPLTVPRLRRELEAFKPDIVHAHNLHWSISYAALRESARFTPRVYMTCHDMMTVAPGKVQDAETFLPTDWISLMTRRALRHAEVVAVSRALAAGLERNGVPVDHVVHNGLPLDEAKPLEASHLQALREAYGLPDDKPLFLFGGRVSALKGIDIALEAIRRTGGHLMVIGARGDNTDHVTYVGWVQNEQMRQFYQLATAVLVPSIYLDPLPTVSLEAFRNRRPVIGTTYGGTPEIVEDGRTGYLVDPHNIQALADRIQVFVDQPAAALSMGESAYHTFLGRFTLAHCVAQLERIYVGAKRPDRSGTV